MILFFCGRPVLVFDAPIDRAGWVWGIYEKKWCRFWKGQLMLEPWGRETPWGDSLAVTARYQV